MRLERGDRGLARDARPPAGDARRAGAGRPGAARVPRRPVVASVPLRGRRRGLPAERERRVGRQAPRHDRRSARRPLAAGSLAMERERLGSGGAPRGGRRVGGRRQLRRRPPRAPGARGRRGRAGARRAAARPSCSPSTRTPRACCARPRPRRRSRRSRRRRSWWPGLGIDRLVVAPFDARLAGLSPEAFAARGAAAGARRAPRRGRRVLPLRPRPRGRPARASRRSGASLGFGVEVVPPVLQGGTSDQQQPRARGARARRRARGARAARPARTSSTARSCAATAAAARSASRRRTSRPRSRSSRRTGSTPPAAACAAERWHDAVVNVGERPTFGGGRVTLEAHLARLRRRSLRRRACGSRSTSGCAASSASRARKRSSRRSAPTSRRRAPGFRRPAAGRYSRAEARV